MNDPFELSCSWIDLTFYKYLCTLFVILTSFIIFHMPTDFFTSNHSVVSLVLPIHYFQIKLCFVHNSLQDITHVLRFSVTWCHFVIHLRSSSQCICNLLMLPLCNLESPLYDMLCPAAIFLRCPVTKPASL